jgi:hypothetical protein
MEATPSAGKTARPMKYRASAHHPCRNIAQDRELSALFHNVSTTKKILRDAKNNN